MVDDVEDEDVDVAIETDEAFLIMEGPIFILGRTMGLVHWSTMNVNVHND